jgi:hypothetical protein
MGETAKEFGRWGQIDHKALRGGTPPLISNLHVIGTADEAFENLMMCPEHSKCKL